MKIHPLLIILFLTISCKNSSQNNGQFTFIEVTYGNPGKVSTVFIDSMWTIIRCKYYYDSASCFIDTLDIALRGSIENKINQLKLSSIDSIYEGDCTDCGSYSIRIGYDNEVVESTIIGLNKFNNRLFSLAFFISGIQINENSLDSTIIFKTTQHPRIKYIPPI